MGRDRSGLGEVDGQVSPVPRLRSMPPHIVILGRRPSPPCQQSRCLDGVGALALELKRLAVAPPSDPAAETTRWPSICASGGLLESMSRPLLACAPGRRCIPRFSKYRLRSQRLSIPDEAAAPLAVRANGRGSRRNVCTGARALDGLDWLVHSMADLFVDNLAIDSEV
jgi:hypothetical protein